MVLNNAKHEKFCQVWHETNNKSQAFRESHPNSLKWKDETVHNKASALSKQGEISARFSELQQESLKGHNITIEQRLKWLSEIREAGMSSYSDQLGNERRENLNAANAAIKTMNDILGTDEQGNGVKPVKVIIGVKDASRH
jgi:hypothetical protein